ncbi:MAG TPA: ABC transporter permease [Caldisericia bacterium]|nr:ABC transporter permease [Caldisericia bacterium]
MSLEESEKRQEGYNKSLSSKIKKWINDSLTLGEMEARRLRHDPTELFTRAVQPVLWLLVFGETFTRIKAIPTGGVPYIAFMTPGILSQSVLFISIFYGLALIWDRDQGIIQKFLALPVPRSAFVVGRTMGAAVRGLSQAVIILLLALIIKVDIRWSIFSVLGTIFVVVLESAFFSCFSMILASLMRTRERFMGIGQVLTMPLFFASSAIYPISIMPKWLQVVAVANPLSYVVEILRSILITGVYDNMLLHLGLLIVMILVAIIIATLLYPRLAS